jgi:hypothetical protein
MYSYRYEVASAQSRWDYHNSLTSYSERAGAIFEYFFGNNDVDLTEIGIGKKHIPGALALLFFILGISAEIVKIKNNNQVSLTIVTAFAVTLFATMGYLVINWPRYFAPLVFFVIYFEVSGLMFLGNIVKFKYVQEKV